MPRQRRLDVPGVLHHVITRGIERRKIFLDNQDRIDFLDRLEIALEKTGGRCYAWVLMPNHVHLLIRTGKTPLSVMMRRLLTGYAVGFNHRHHRHGYLFQNRYKSILCQEDAYFMELVRYIHLNPVRAKLLETMEKLDQYPWSGHGVLVGTRKAKWQERGEVLNRFGKRESSSIAGYRQFLKEGWGMGRREDLMGGGLRRSAGGWQALLAMRRNKDYQRGDERILGDGDFVNEVLKASEEALAGTERLFREGWTWERLVQRACEINRLSPQDLKRKGRSNAISQAKAMLTDAGLHRLGMKQKDIAEQLGISQGALSQIYRANLQGIGDILLSKDRP
ncbi:MAG: transposase [Elusimicrobia bacterium]|nr:transposase [Elusimicrobiota bacterium]